jgi:hypothetical protein
MHARWFRSPDRGTSSASATEGVRASMTRRGARDLPASAMCVSRSPCPSLGDARPMLPGEVIPRAPSLHRGQAPTAQGPRLERGDAPARGTRRGSTESMAPWRHLTAGSNPVARVSDAGGLRLRTGRVELAKGGNTRCGRTRWRAPQCRAGGANHPGGTRCASSEWARPATVVRWATNPQEFLHGARSPVLRKANADRGGSLARRRIHGSRACPRVEHALQRSVVQSQAQRSPCETPTFWISVQARRGPVPIRVITSSCSRWVGGGSGRG